MKYKKCCTLDNDASVPFKVGSLGPHTVLPPAAPLYFPESHLQSEISSLSKVIQFWETPDVPGHQIWAVGVVGGC